jgi:hypothetical protein
MMQHRIAASLLISVSNASNVHVRQSALNLIYMLGYSHPVNFEVFGPCSYVNLPRPFCLSVSRC